MKKSPSFLLLLLLLHCHFTIITITNVDTSVCMCQALCSDLYRQAFFGDPCDPPSWCSHLCVTPSPWGQWDM